MNRHDDSGASLIMALIVVTVFSVVVAALMTFADASLLTTVRLRDQAGATASAEGAAQIAINTLRRGTYDGSSGQCFGSTDALPLPSFYQPASGPADSAIVTCEPDSAHASAGSPVAINSRNKPANAILTLGPVAGEDGLTVDTADGRTLRVHGSVFANSTIAVPRGGLESSSTVTARGACAGMITAAVPATCSTGAEPNAAGDDPRYPTPAVTPAPGSVTICTRNSQLVTFSPGVYTDLTSLNNMTRCKNTIFFFPPGTYYFNFGGAWIIDQGYLVAGTPTTTLVAGTPPTMPGSCRSPVPPVPPDPSWTPPGPGAGVQFVFGGTSQLVLRQTRAEICGSYAPASPPIAIYGLTTSVGSVPAQSGCTVAGPYPSTGCAVIKVEPGAASMFFVQGTAYVPHAALDIAASNPAGLLFSVGVIARTLRLAPTSTAVLTDPVIEVPDDAEVGRRTVVYLAVYVCPGSGTCSVLNGRQRLRVKLGILDRTGSPVAGAREITVFTWSVLR